MCRRRRPFTSWQRVAWLSYGAKRWHRPVVIWFERCLPGWQDWTMSADRRVMAVSERPRVVSHLRAYRHEAGMSQLMLAGLARTTGRAVRAFELGDITTHQIGILIRIAAVLECGAADIMPVLGSVRRAPDVGSKRG